MRWLNFYQATEISPGEYRAFNRGYSAEYGLFSPDGQVTGRRRYGKNAASKFFVADPPTEPPPEFERSAFCQIYRWARARGYGNDPASPCAG